ncbi:hypothetical protein AAC387_Pa01g2350 [Persea americana]
MAAVNRYRCKCRRGWQLLLAAALVQGRQKGRQVEGQRGGWLLACCGAGLAARQHQPWLLPSWSESQEGRGSHRDLSGGVH